MAFLDQRMPLEMKLCVILFPLLAALRMTGMKLAFACLRLTAQVGR